MNKVIRDYFEKRHIDNSKNYRCIKAMEIHHQEAITKLYYDHGVGDTVDHKYNFWNIQNPNGWYISHNPTKEQCVKIFELTWLSEHFPADF